MLDKSVPYFDFIMHRKPGLLPECELPNGFRFSHFQAGDEKEWAQIETSVLEFDRAVDALVYFQKEYLPYLLELERRCLFVENTQGKKVGTANAWWGYNGKRRVAWLHWVAVMPEYQGLGLGKAIVYKTLRLMTEIEGEVDVYLHTQTWSHRAVGIYQKAGFEISAEKGLGGHANDHYQEALTVLAEIKARSERREG